MDIVPHTLVNKACSRMPAEIRTRVFALRCIIKKRLEERGVSLEESNFYRMQSESNKISFLSFLMIALKL